VIRSSTFAGRAIATVCTSTATDGGAARRARIRQRSTSFNLDTVGGPKAWDDAQAPARARASGGPPMAAAQFPQTAIVRSVNKNAQGTGHRSVADGFRRRQIDHLLHVRGADAASMWHLRGGQVRHIEGNRNHPVNKGALCGKGASGRHAALFSGAASQTAEARRRARQIRVLSRSNGTRPWRSPRSGCQPFAAVIPRSSRSSPDAIRGQSLTGWLGIGIRDAEFRRPRRLLLGQHGRRRPLHDWRLVLGGLANPIGTARGTSSSLASRRTMTPIRSKRAWPS